jgi:hypothetical protein
MAEKYTSRAYARGVCAKRPGTLLVLAQKLLTKARENGGEAFDPDQQVVALSLRFEQAKHMDIPF